MKWTKIDSVLISNTVIITFKAEKTIKGIRRFYQKVKMKQVTQ